MKIQIPKIIINPIQKFLNTEAASSIILVLCSVVAMSIANSAWSSHYFLALHFDILGLSFQHWINDGLMSIFFFVIGMEIKKELLVGELSTARKAALPIAAAIGGMIVPAAIYYWINPSHPDYHGWGIPMATDIAFALGVLTLFGKRVPLSLKIFLLALAIVDDLGAVLVIAFFYTKEIHGTGLALAATALGFIILLRSMNVKSYLLYIILGLVVWFGIFISGVHATIAGVLIGLLTPYKFPIAKGTKETYSPLENLVRLLHPVVVFGIMPIFALANAGIELKGVDILHLVRNPIHQGVFFGLLLGKPIGIFIFSRLAVLLKFTSLPPDINWKHIMGVSFLGGIGFTMSLFISGLALQPAQEIYSKTGVVFGSISAVIIGSTVLLVTFNRSPKVFTLV